VRTITSAPFEVATAYIHTCALVGSELVPTTLGSRYMALELEKTYGGSE
jgi:hypothetical protein